MNHLVALRAATLATALAALAINLQVLQMAYRQRRAMKAMQRVTKQTICDAWRGGLEQAANAIGKLAEQRPDEMDPVVHSTLLYAERVIHECIREVRNWSPQ